jgi:hypothetical protein
MPTVGVRVYVKVRGQDAYRKRTPAEFAAAAKKAAEKEARSGERKRQRVIDGLKKPGRAR